MKLITFRLAPKERRFLRDKKRGEKLTHRVRVRIDALLMTDQGTPAGAIANALQVTHDTVWRIKRRYLAQGLAAALTEKPRPGSPRKYTVRHETELVALACSTPPAGSKRWTLELLSEKMCSSVKGCQTINRESIRLMLKKTKLSLG